MLIMLGIKDTFVDELGIRKKMIHAGPMGANCEYAETLRAMAWLIYSRTELRTAYERSIWRNGEGLDKNPAVPFVRWLAAKNRQTGVPNIYTIGWFTLSIRGHPKQSTSFPAV